MDDFARELASASKSRNQILSGLEERSLKNSRGETDGYLDSKLRGWLKDFAVNFDSLQRQLESYKVNPERARLSVKELERRTLLVEELEKDLNELEIKVKSGNKNAVVGVGVNFRRDGSEENESTRNLSNRDLQQAQVKMMKDQGAVEEAILGSTQNLVSISQNMTDELTIHEGLLDDVNKNVDTTQVRIDKTNFRMKELIYKSNDCCLLTVILVLIAVILVIIFFL
jgi:hypothetical protein